MNAPTPSRNVVILSFYDRVTLTTRYLSAILKEAGHQAHLICFKDDRSGPVENFVAENRYYQLVFNNQFTATGEDYNPPTDEELQLLVDRVRALDPDVIALSARSVAVDLSRRVAAALQEVLPDVRYIGGGYGPTVEPEKFLPFLDYVCLGEGDRAILDLVELDDPRGAPNVAWLEQGEVRRGELAPALKMDDIAWPDWGPEDKYLIDDGRIHDLAKVFDAKAYDVFASRGCPMDCTYCMACHWPRLYAAHGGEMPRVRLRSPRNLIDELKHAVDRYGIEYVRFKDSIFGYNKAWFREFMALYEKEIGLRFLCYLDERCIDAERIRALKGMGLNRTVVGIQSACERIRRDVFNRRSSDDDLKRYAEMVKAEGIRIQYDLIGWNPFETEADLAEGAKFLRRMPKGEEVVVFHLKTFPGSPLSERIARERPAGLSTDVYTYWAWLYQMILRSEESEKLSSLIERYEAFKRHPLLLRDLMDEALGQWAERHLVAAARKIEKGERITKPMTEWVPAKGREGIPIEEMSRLSNCCASRDLVPGELIRWNDLYGSYGSVGPACVREASAAAESG